MGYPKLVIDKEKLGHNVREMISICKKRGIEVCGVTKVYGGILEVEEVYIENGIKTIGHARLENLKAMEHLDVKKLLLRLPMLSECEDLVKYVDIALVSEIEIIRKISEEGKKINKKQDIILMIDLGDLREGIIKEEVNFYVEEIIKLENVNLKGIGVNLTCFGGVIPTNENLGELVEIGKRIEKEFEIKLDIISGGNSSTLYKVLDGTVPEGINHLRVGEGIIFGTEAGYQEKIPNMNYDVPHLELEVIELKEKNSAPTGEIGVNAFGKKVEFENIGKIIRCIVACGKQDVEYKDITPKNDKIKIIGGSSDHTIIDVTKSDKNIEHGDILNFGISYTALLALGTSKYVYKEVR